MSIDSSFKELFFKYYSALVVFATRYLNDEEASKDIVQDVFARLYPRYAKLTMQTDAKNYLYRAVYNTCISEIRRQMMVKKNLVQFEYEQESSFFNEAVEQTENERKLAITIESLPPKCKQILVMSKLEGIKNSDIAEKLQISQRTVETQISLALKRLREALCSIIF